MSALITESLEARLARLVPGATLVRTPALGAAKGWSVVREGQLLATGPTQRDAIDKAQMLYGVQR